MEEQVNMTPDVMRSVLVRHYGAPERVPVEYQELLVEWERMKKDPAASDATREYMVRRLDRVFGTWFREHPHLMWNMRK